jgi:hypothetical protein
LTKFIGGKNKQKLLKIALALRDQLINNLITKTSTTNFNELKNMIFEKKLKIQKDLKIAKLWFFLFHKRSHGTQLIEYCIPLTAKNMFNSLENLI